MDNNIEVVYASEHRQFLRVLTWQPEMTVQQAIEQSGVGSVFPELDIKTCKKGIYGKLVDAKQPLIAGDRVEIYRLLITNPMQARRQRAKPNLPFP